MALNLKANHNVIRSYYEEIQQKQQLSFIHEGTVAPHFANLLRYCGKQVKWNLIEQYPIPRKGHHPLKADGALLDEFKLVHGVWEAKDTEDDLPVEAKKKFQVGYPKDNILFQAPDRALLYQDGILVIDADITRPANLVETLKLFFGYQPPQYEQWELAVEEFKGKVPELARSLLHLIEEERKYNKQFVQAFNDFSELVRQAINPNISLQALEEMLIQHLLTERIFRKVFDNPDFANRNIIAIEIEKVIQALTARHFSRADFLRQLDRFYGAIEATAATIDDFSQKQAFLNTVYEKFFQGFSIKVADTHGIVYTPQPIVDFMVRSVDDILRREFGKPQGLASQGVHILDPFVGTGNFILRIMRHIPKTQLPHKYAHELHCNEVMLLPYYIAAMNIEHEYFELTGQYQPFEGICMVDTFELAEGKQMPLFVQANTQRVEQQTQTPIFVVIGNPPYNAHQVNENDNSKNRKYQRMDERVSKTYAAASMATNKNALSDPYVKAIRWAADRIGEEGVVAFVTNSSFVDQITFDGMRRHLEQDFDAIYILDLGGNVRKNPKLSGSTHNVFGIQVGVSVNIFVRKQASPSETGPRQAKICYYRTEEFWRKEEKYSFLEQHPDHTFINWQVLTPDKRHTWLTAGLQADFETFLPMGTQEAKAGGEYAIFKLFSNGVKTNRDTWAYNFSQAALAQNIHQTIAVYNDHAQQWAKLSQKLDINDFVSTDSTKISWSEGLKAAVRRQVTLTFDEENIRLAFYRPFTRTYLYFDKYMNERQYQIPVIFPTPEAKNCVIWLKVGTEWPMFALMVDKTPDLLPQGGSQCFPFYTYSDNGNNQQENITDWALEQFHAQYQDETLTKWDIFHYVYALLHHPHYRQIYAANLRRELPRIPFAEDFWGFAKAGARLAEIHVHYERQPEYPLRFLETPGEPLNWRVERIRLSKDRSQLKYNDFLTLAGIPPETFDYRLGNRSALEWVIDQYQVTTDKRSGIVNDPNNPDDEQYIVRLVGQVITVSLETVEIVKKLPPLDL